MTGHLLRQILTEGWLRPCLCAPPHHLGLKFRMLQFMAKATPPTSVCYSLCGAPDCNHLVTFLETVQLNFIMKWLNSITRYSHAQDVDDITRTYEYSFYLHWTHSWVSCHFCEWKIQSALLLMHLPVTRELWSHTGLEGFVSHQRFCLYLDTCLYYLSHMSICSLSPSLPPRDYSTLNH